MEPTYQMSVFPKQSKHPLTREDLNLPDPPPKGPVTFTGLPIPLILDGKVRVEALRKIGQNELWLKREIRKYGIKDIRDVSFCSIDERGIMYLDKKTSRKNSSRQRVCQRRGKRRPVVPRSTECGVRPASPKSGKRQAAKGIKAYWPLNRSTAGGQRKRRQTSAKPCRSLR